MYKITALDLPTGKNFTLECAEYEYDEGLGILYLYDADEHSVGSIPYLQYITTIEEF